MYVLVAEEIHMYVCMCACYALPVVVQTPAEKIIALVPHPSKRNICTYFRYDEYKFNYVRMYISEIVYICTSTIHICIK